MKTLKDLLYYQTSIIVSDYCCRRVNLTCLTLLLSTLYLVIIILFIILNQAAPQNFKTVSGRNWKGVKVWAFFKCAYIQYTSVIGCVFSGLQ